MLSSSLFWAHWLITVTFSCLVNYVSPKHLKMLVIETDWTLFCHELCLMVKVVIFGLFSLGFPLHIHSSPMATGACKAQNSLGHCELQMWKTYRLKSASQFLWVSQSLWFLINKKHIFYLRYGIVKPSGPKATTSFSAKLVLICLMFGFVE